VLIRIDPQTNGSLRVCESVNMINQYMSFLISDKKQKLNKHLEHGFFKSNKL